MTLGIPFSIYYGDNDIYVLLFSGIGTAGIGGLTFYFTKDHRKDIKKKDGYIIVSSSWLVMSLFGAIPFVIHGSIPSYTDAFFETMSGFTTTGASILNNIEELPHGLLFWRSITQWMGGMGMIVLSLAILPVLGIGGMQLFVAEVPGPTKDKIHPRIGETAKRLWGIYVIFTLVETVLLYLGGMTVFESINHAFTTMATGGFSTKQASIAAYDSPYLQYVMIVFMFAAGINFSLHYHLLHFNFKVFSKNEEFKFYTKLTVVIALLVAVVLYFSNYADLEKSFRDSLFQVVSLITTTGYVTADYEMWGPFFQVLFFLLLFIGGCAGSTGGGIKVVRHLLLFKNSLLELRRLIHPRAVIPVRFNGTAVPQDIISNVLAFFLFYILIFVVGTIIMSILGLDFLSAIGSVATSLGNVGPAIGSVGPSYNFAHIPDLGKWLLSILMLMGRLELFTILIIFSPAFYKK
ncbi:MAG: TrkH family potassium uptake protein [Melioribacteraceae bacterium]|nr:TrkH family potassium uptake protein [Melioribacteraceae bacterium]MCF8263788.1 TrkH family potassium uptake protein [Melioribacteraceae bacterium]MCF8412367.1 TrkH family potassium uptake protein [Melioribacteraceae bacterium]MCF8430779.1 TrkH family potassium uptake protein [Melioribacteraceae bacterium]